LQTIAKYGKHLAGQIPQGSVGPGEELPPYLGSNVTRVIKTDMLVELESLKNLSLSRSSASKKCSTSSLRDNSFKDSSIIIDNGRLSNPSPSSRGNSPLPLKTESPRISTLLPTTPGAFVNSPLPPPSKTVYLQGAVPVPSKEFHPPETIPFYVQPTQAQVASQVAPQFVQPQYARPATKQQIFGTRPVPGGGEESRRYEDYPDYYTTVASSLPSTLSRPEQLYYQQSGPRKYECSVMDASEELIACAFCLSGIKADDMNRHLDSNCRLHIVRLND
jgi:hypothetical protein